jgi:hypothetical protein
MNGKTMTSGSSIKSSKHGLSKMLLGETKIFETPTERDRELVRRAAHNQNERSERRYMTRSKGDTIHVTRVR